MRSTVSREKVTRPNQSSEKLLRLMEVLSEQDEPIRLHDLAKEADLNISTTLRFIMTLQNTGYVAQDPSTDRYYMTYKIVRLANSILSRMNICRICEPFLKQLVNISGESANLTIEQDMQVVYILVINNPSYISMVQQPKRIGNIAPMHCTGTGKLMLLNYSEKELDHLISVRGLQQYTQNTITSKEALLKELDQIRAQGFALDNEECEPGKRCIAVPIYDYSNRIMAGISISLPTIRYTEDIQNQLLKHLLDAGESISQQFGYYADSLVHNDSQTK